jgi:hypothetical protein
MDPVVDRCGIYRVNDIGSYHSVVTRYWWRTHEDGDTRGSDGVWCHAGINDKIENGYVTGGKKAFNPDL